MYVSIIYHGLNQAFQSRMKEIIDSSTEVTRCQLTKILPCYEKVLEIRTRPLPFNIVIEVAVLRS